MSYRFTNDFVLRQRPEYHAEALMDFWLSGVGGSCFSKRQAHDVARYWFERDGLSLLMFVRWPFVFVGSVVKSESLMVLREKGQA